jgi:zinc protease
VHSSSVEGLEPGFFLVQLCTSPDKRERALEGIREQLARLRDDLVSTAELEGAKAHLIGVHAIGLQRRQSLAATMVLDHAYGLSAESYLRYPEEIGAVDARQVRELALSYLDPAAEVVAVVGP